MNSYNLPFYFRFCFLFLIIISSCNEVDKMEIEKSASAFDIKQGEASIKRSNQVFMKSFEDADSVEVANCYTTNAHIMMADTPDIEGREGIKNMVSKMMNKGITRFDLNSLQIWGDSAMLVEEGTYKLYSKENESVDKGKYITLWKVEGGNWRMYRQMWNSNLKPASLLPEKVRSSKK